MRRETPSFEAILEDFSPNEHARSGAVGRGCITVWLTPGDKARYDRLQERSRRDFGKRARAALLALMDLAESKVAG